MSQGNTDKGAIGKGFADFIQKDRKRKQNEDLAAQVFKRPSMDGISRATPSRSTPSLASRIGVQKRPINRRAVSDNQSIPVQKRAKRIATALSNMTSQDDVMVDATWSGTKHQAAELNIKGRGDKITVIAQNFAPGTSIIDVESVMAGSPEQCLLSSRLISASPTVMAELVFGSRSAAQEVVTQFNNQLADGRLLHVYIQPAPSTRPPPRQQQSNRDRNGPERKVPAQPSLRASESMDIDSSPATTQQPHQSNGFRSDPPRAPRAPQFEDGKYGFSNGQSSRTNNRPFSSRQGRGSYGRLASDAMMRGGQSSDRRPNW